MKQADIQPTAVALLMAAPALAPLLVPVELTDDAQALGIAADPGTAPKNYGVEEYLAARGLHLLVSPPVKASLNEADLAGHCLQTFTFQVFIRYRETIARNAGLDLDAETTVKLCRQTLLAKPTTEPNIRLRFRSGNDPVEFGGIVGGESHFLANFAVDVITTPDDP